MEIVILVTVSFIIAMLIPAPGQHSPDVAKLIAQIIKAVTKKL